MAEPTPADRDSAQRPAERRDTSNSSAHRVPRRGDGAPVSSTGASLQVDPKAGSKAAPDAGSESMSGTGNEVSAVWARARAFCRQPQPRCCRSLRLDSGGAESNVPERAVCRRPSRPARGPVAGCSCVLCDPCMGRPTPPPSRSPSLGTGREGRSSTPVDPQSQADSPQVSPVLEDMAIALRRKLNAPSDSETGAVVASPEVSPVLKDMAVALGRKLNAPKDMASDADVRVSDAGPVGYDKQELTVAGPSKQGSSLVGAGVQGSMPYLVTDGRETIPSGSGIEGRLAYPSDERETSGLEGQMEHAPPVESGLEGQCTRESGERGSKNESRDNDDEKKQGGQCIRESGERGSENESRDNDDEKKQGGQCIRESGERGSENESHGNDYEKERSGQCTRESEEQGSENEMRGIEGEKDDVASDTSEANDDSGFKEINNNTVSKLVTASIRKTQRKLLRSCRPFSRKRPIETNNAEGGKEDSKRPRESHEDETPSHTSSTNSPRTTRAPDRQRHLPPFLRLRRLPFLRPRRPKPTSDTAAELAASSSSDERPTGRRGRRGARRLRGRCRGRGRITALSRVLLGRSAPSPAASGDDQRSDARGARRPRGRGRGRGRGRIGAQSRVVLGSSAPPAAASGDDEKGPEAAVSDPAASSPSTVPTVSYQAVLRTSPSSDIPLEHVLPGQTLQDYLRRLVQTAPVPDGDSTPRQIPSELAELGQIVTLKGRLACVVRSLGRVWAVPLASEQEAAIRRITRATDTEPGSVGPRQTGSATTKEAAAPSGSDEPTHTAGDDQTAHAPSEPDRQGPVSSETDKQRPASSETDKQEVTASSEKRHTTSGSGGHNHTPSGPGSQAQTPAVPEKLGTSLSEVDGKQDTECSGSSSQGPGSLECDKQELILAISSKSGSNPVGSEKRGSAPLVADEQEGIPAGSGNKESLTSGSDEPETTSSDPKGQKRAPSLGSDREGRFIPVSGEQGLAPRTDKQAFAASVSHNQGHASRSESLVPEPSHSDKPEHAPAIDKQGPSSSKSDNPGHAPSRADNHERTPSAADTHGHTSSNSRESGPLAGFAMSAESRQKIRIGAALVSRGRIVSLPTGRLGHIIWREGDCQVLPLTEPQEDAVREYQRYMNRSPSRKDRQDLGRADRPQPCAAASSAPGRAGGDPPIPGRLPLPRRPMPGLVRVADWAVPPPGLATSPPRSQPPPPRPPPPPPPPRPSSQRVGHLAQPRPPPKSPSPPRPPRLPSSQPPPRPLQSSQSLLRPLQLSQPQPRPLQSSQPLPRPLQSSQPPPRPQQSSVSAQATAIVAASAQATAIVAASAQATAVVAASAQAAATTAVAGVAATAQAAATTNSHAETS